MLTDYYASPSSSTEIIQYTPYGGGYQTWFLSWQDNGYYVIQNVATGLFLAAPAAGSSAGSSAQHAQATFDESELWSLTTGPTGYVIRSKSTGMVLGDPGSSLAPTAIGLQAGTPTSSNLSWNIQAAK